MVFFSKCNYELPCNGVMLTAIGVIFLNRVMSDRVMAFFSKCYYVCCVCHFNETGLIYIITLQWSNANCHWGTFLLSDKVKSTSNISIVCFTLYDNGVISCLVIK